MRDLCRMLVARVPDAFLEMCFDQIVTKTELAGSKLENVGVSAGCFGEIMGIVIDVPVVGSIQNESIRMHIGELVIRDQIVVTTNPRGRARTVPDPHVDEGIPEDDA